MKKMRQQLIKLLGIHGISGQETNVRSYLKPILENSMDTVTIDNYGNLLADKQIGNGKGATVLLSAHMDTVRGVLANRELIEKDGVITSSEGVLGADDRAGIAIILAVLRNLEKSTSFNGNLKIAFSREEEIGCKGADKIKTSWYEGVDLAIVVDRRGNRDIVTGCSSAFCSNEVGNFMEEVSKLCGMDWKCVEGGVSDAMSFSSNGINSINLSAGYEHEHTSKEYVVLNDMADTVRLIMQTFAVINDFCHTFGDVPDENNWVSNWYGGKYGGNYGYNYYEDTWGRKEDVWAEVVDEEEGHTYAYEIGADIVIQQGDNEIVLSRQNLRSLMNQLKNV